MHCKPHPEVVNSQPSVLIVGWGHVGQHLGQYFTEADYVDVDGVIQLRGAVANLGEGERGEGDHIGSPLRYDLGFICVPTPEGEDGRCDTSAVEAAFERWRRAVEYWCIKSTVSVGTTELLGHNVCFSPEYYGETLGHPLAEVNRETFVILGGPADATQAFADAWSLVTSSYTRIIQTDARTAELCKLLENAWIATKVSFCNEFYDLARLAGVDWHELRELWLADPRVSRSHTYVYPRNRGWGGKCIPKDTANLCEWARRFGRPAELIEAVRAYNARLRA